MVGPNGLFESVLRRRLTIYDVQSMNWHTMNPEISAEELADSHVQGAFQPIPATRVLFTFKRSLTFEDALNKYGIEHMRYTKCLEYVKC